MDNLSLPDGTTINSASLAKPLLFVFVRHKGCTFCREALSELKNNLPLLESKKLKIYVVHMGPPSTSIELANEYNLKTVDFISDPGKKFYTSFGLKRGSLKQLLGPRVWLRGFQAGVLKGHGVGGLEGDGLQMGGIFLMHKGQIKKLHDPCDAADIGDWSQIAQQI